MQPSPPMPYPRQLSPSGLCLLPPLTPPCLLEKGAHPTPQHELPTSKESPPSSRYVPRLRAVVESQAFKNILVDEMDMMHSRAATLIQSNWRGYRLRQKMVSQMTAAKAIQEAWRRFSMRRLLRSRRLFTRSLSKDKEKDEGDIPYHPPQQVRFHSPETCSPAMVSKETQFPSSDNLVSPAVVPPCISRVALLSPQNLRLTPKPQPCLVAKIERGSCVLQHLETDVAKSKQGPPQSAARTGPPEPAVAGRYGPAVPGAQKTRMEVDVPKATPQAHPLPKTPPKTHPGVPPPRPPAAMHSAPKAGPTQPGPLPRLMVMKSLPQPGLVAQTPSASSSVRPSGPTARVPPQMCLLNSGSKAVPPSRPGAPVSKSPAQPGPLGGLSVMKPPDQARPTSAPTRGPQLASPRSTLSKTSQVSRCTRVSPHTRLAAMITKTPAQIRSVAAVLRTLCLVPPAAACPKAPPQPPGAPGVPTTPSHGHLNLPKTKAAAGTKQPTALPGMSPHVSLAEGKGQVGPHVCQDAAAPRPPPRAPTDAERLRTCPPKGTKKEMPPKTHVGMSRAVSWTKVPDACPRPPAEQPAEVVRAVSKVYMPVGTPVNLPPAQLAVPLTKASPITPARCQSHPASHLARTLNPTPQAGSLTLMLPEGPTSTVLTSPQLARHLMVLSAQFPLATQPALCGRHATGPSLQTPLPATSGLPDGHPNPPCPPQMTTTTAQPLKAPVQPRPPADRVTTVPPSHLGGKSGPRTVPTTKLIKAPSLAQLISCLTRVPSQARLPIGLTKAQSQAQLATHLATELSSKAQSQPLLTGPKVSVQFWRHLGNLGSGPRTKQEERGVAQPHGHAQSKATQATPQAATVDLPGTLVPLLTAARHHPCNTESWGDSHAGRPPPPPPPPPPPSTPNSQAVPGQEDVSSSQTASLCADLVTMLGSPEDLRALLAKVMSQGEVRSALGQALSREVLGPSVSRALPPGLLGMALAKALSWGELGVTLSRALSRGEQRPELTKAAQAKLAEVLNRVLSTEERLALCQGELSAAVGPSLSHVTQKSGAGRPKVTLKTTGGRMSTRVSNPVEVTCRQENVSLAWGPPLGVVRPQCAKVRRPWEGDPRGRQPVGALWGAGDGFMSEGSPCSPWPPLNAFYSRRTVAAVRLHPQTTGLNPIMSPGVGTAWDPGPLLISLDLDSMACGEGSRVPQRPRRKPPPSPCWLLMANGVGPSANQPLGSQQAPAAGKVTPHPWATPREDRAVSRRSSGCGGGGWSSSAQPSATCGGAQECGCQSPRRAPSCTCGSPTGKTANQLAKVTGGGAKRTPSSTQRLGSPGSRDLIPTVKRGWAGRDDASRPRISLKSRLARVLPCKTTSRQGRIPVRVSLLAIPPLQDSANSHRLSILQELLSVLPQHPRKVLDKSFSQGPAPCLLGCSDSRSSQHTSRSSLSTASTVAPSHLLEGSCNNSWWDGCGCQSLQSRGAEDRGRSKHKERGGPRPTVPRMQPVPPGIPSILLHSARLALSLQWDSDSGSDYSTDLVEEGPSETCEPGDAKAPATGQESPHPSPSPGAGEHTPLPNCPLEAAGSGPSPSEPVVVGAVSPNLTPMSVDAGVAPNLTEPIMCYGVSAGFPQPIMCYRGSPNIIQPYLAPGVTPSLTQPALTTEVVPSSVAASSVGTGVSPNFFQPLMSYTMPPRLAQPVMVGVLSPSLAGVPTVASGVIPAHPVLYSSFSQPSMDALGSLSLMPPTVVCGVGHGISEPAQASPTTLSPGRSLHPTTKTGPSSSVLTTGDSSAQGSAFKLQPASPWSPQGHRAPPDTRPTQSLPQISVTPTKDTGGIPCQKLLRGVATGTSQSPVATGMFLSMSPGVTPASLAAGQPWRSVATLSHGPCHASWLQAGLPLGSSLSQPCMPVMLAPPLHPVTMGLMPTCHYAMAGGFLPIEGTVPLTVVPKPTPGSVTFSFPQGPVAGGAAQDAPRESPADGKAQGPSPGALANDAAPSHPAPCPARDVTLDPPQGSVASGVTSGSMLIGLSPRPYYGAQAGESASLPLTAPQAASVSPVALPRAPDTGSVEQSPTHFPLVLARTTQFDREPAAAILGPGVPHISPPKAGQADEVPTVGSRKDFVKSEAPEDTLWMDQRPPEMSEEETPGQAASPQTDSRQPRGAPVLPQRPTAKKAGPRVTQNLGMAGIASLAPNTAPNVSHMEASRSLTPSYPQEAISLKKSYRSIQSTLVGEVPEDSADRVHPSIPLQKRANQNLLGHPKLPAGATPAGVMPVIHLGDTAHGGKGQKAPSTTPNLALAFESPPGGFQRPVQEQTTPGDTLSPTQGAPLTPCAGKGPDPPGAGYDGSSPTQEAPQSQKPSIPQGPHSSYDGGSPIYFGLAQDLRLVQGPQAAFAVGALTLPEPPETAPLLAISPGIFRDKVSPTLTVPQGPADTAKPGHRPGPPRAAWAPIGGPGPWDSQMGERKPSGELLLSVRAMESVIVRAVVTIQAGARGFLVRRCLKIWGHWATVIQAQWRGYRVRRNLARLLRAATVIQAGWRGHCVRRELASRTLLPLTAGDRVGAEEPRGPEHRCFLSCQPDVCDVCQALSLRLNAAPSVMLLVGSEPRICHVCGHALATRVVQGVGLGSRGGAAGRRSARRPQSQLQQQQQAATTIQAAWRGYRTRRHLRHQQAAAKTVQATWRGHYTRSCLTTDALLGVGGPWGASRGSSRHSSSGRYGLWPGV